MWMAMLPSVPTGAMTRLGTVWPLSSLGLRATGRRAPSAYTVTFPVAVVLVAATSTATYPLSLHDALPISLIGTAIVCPADTAPLAAPLPYRVSNTRVGV